MTKFTLPRRGLKDAVAGFGKVVTGRTSLPVLGCARLTAGKTGVTAQVTDLDQVLEYQFGDAQVSGEGVCILPMTSLKDLAKGSKDECIDIETDDPLSISVTNHVGGHSITRVVEGMELDEWPTMLTDIPTQHAESPFLETYRRLTPFASTDETRYTINSVFVEVGKGETPVTMAATDGRRLAAFNSMELPLTKSIILPVTKFLSWNRLADVEIGARDEADQPWFGMKAGAFSYAVKCVDGIYPDFRQVIPAELGEHLVTFSDGDVDLLKQVLPSFPGDEEVTLVGDAGKVTLYGRGPNDAQWTTITLEATAFEGDRVYIGVNRSYLLDALAAGFRDLTIRDELSPLLSRDGKGGTHVLMPMRGIDPEDKGSTPETTAVDVEVETEAPVAPEAVSEPAAVAAEVQANGMPVAKTETVETKPTRRRTRMTKENEQKNDGPALDRVVAACDTARAKVKEVGQALSELAAAIKDTARDQKAQAKDVESARTALAKLQAISL
jgi:DNA polymerase III sliding clamp (beta) subunit (PCNA family)